MPSPCEVRVRAGLTVATRYSVFKMEGTVTALQQVNIHVCAASPGTMENIPPLLQVCSSLVGNATFCFDLRPCPDEGEKGPGAAQEPEGMSEVRGRGKSDLQESREACFSKRVGGVV